MVLIDIVNPRMNINDEKELWELLIESLKKSNKIESVSVYVNNDISDKIASNLADRVPMPWHQGYQGYNTTTLIHHK